MEFEKLYHRDSADKLRVWWMESDGPNYRTHSGIVGGSIVTSDWRLAEAKNVGRANATTAEEQSILEIESTYRNKKDLKYTENPDEAQRRNFMEPQLANKFDLKKFLKRKQLFWHHQPKLDGIRTLLDHSGSNSRVGKPFHTVQHIIDELGPISERYNVTFDGELYNHDLKDEFEQLVSYIKKQKISSVSEITMSEIRAKVQLHVYDAIFHDEPHLTFLEREKRIREITSELNQDTFRLVDSAPIHIDIDDPEVVHGGYILAGYEGMMFRNPFSPYTFGRSNELLKHKNFEEEEMEVLEVRDGLGNWAGKVKSVTVRTPKGTTSGITPTGSMDYLAKLWEIRDELPGTQVTGKFQGYTADDALRFGTIKKWHFGKREI